MAKQRGYEIVHEYSDVISGSEASRAREATALRVQSTRRKFKSIVAPSLPCFAVKTVIPNPVAFQTGEGSAVSLLWPFNPSSSPLGTLPLQDPPKLDSAAR